MHNATHAKRLTAYSRLSHIDNDAACEQFSRYMLDLRCAPIHQVVTRQPFVLGGRL